MRKLRVVRPVGSHHFREGLRPIPTITGSPFDPIPLPQHRNRERDLREIERSQKESREELRERRWCYE